MNGALPCRLEKKMLTTSNPTMDEKFSDSPIAENLSQKVASFKGAIDDAPPCRLSSTRYIQALIRHEGHDMRRGIH